MVSPGAWDGPALAIPCPIILNIKTGREKSIKKRKERGGVSDWSASESGQQAHVNQFSCPPTPNLTLIHTPRLYLYLFTSISHKSHIISVRRVQCPNRPYLEEMMKKKKAIRR